MNTEQPDTTAEADTAEPWFITLALSEDGERTGRTKRLRARRPSDTQAVWFEAAFHRFNLAVAAIEGLEPAEAAATFDLAERGELFNDLIDAVNVFVATGADRQWVSRAMARGTLEFDAVIEGITEAAEHAGIALTGGPAADVTVD